MNTTKTARNGGHWTKYDNVRRDTYYEVYDPDSFKRHLETLSEDEAKGHVSNHYHRTGVVLTIAILSHAEAAPGTLRSPTSSLEASAHG